MNIGIIGVNFKSADLFFREKLAQKFQKRYSSDELEDFSKVVLSTCNRFEIYFSSDDLTQTHSLLLKEFTKEFKKDCGFKLYSYFGQDCFLHLSQVTAGFDSAILAETEIQGQVKRAYLKAQKQSLAKELHFIFQKSLKIGKSIRSNISLKPGAPNLVKTVSSLLGNLKKIYQKPHILFVGTSEINTKIIQQMPLDAFNVSLCSRSLDRSSALAQKLGVQVVNWESLSYWQTFNGIVFASSYPHYILVKEEGEVNQKKLLIDLSVPRNVHPSLCKKENIQLLNIDQVNKLVRRYRTVKSDELIEATNRIQSAITNQCHIFKSKTQYPQKIYSIV
ncbi:MAG: Glutamyl-tRNA reductase [Chlamydiae bacterium]|nr:Glutamyl-tRNA reductase [Chlamydiota bacterium]